MIGLQRGWLAPPGTPPGSGFGLTARRCAGVGVWLAGLVLLIGLGGCQKAAAPLTVKDGPRNPEGFEVRYNATLALARMACDDKDSNGIKGRLDVLKEMLDEEQQLRSFRRRIDKDGKAIPEGQAQLDPVAARTTVESALKVIQKLHEKRPDIDLSSLAPAVEKLTHSDNAVLRTEAERTRLALAQKPN